MNSTSTSRIYSVQLVGDDRDPSSTPSPLDRLQPVFPQSNSETDYDLIQLCDDLAEIEPDNHQTG
ncbi:MAG: hypothetical protein WBD58_07515 [Geitlerinemataceae cyanobacterium]